jgi:hypothetical protein
LATVFNVTLDGEQMLGQGVLVFLRPVTAQRDVFIHAWQVLIASSGDNESFEYESVISTNVFSRRNPPHYILSDTMEVRPGSLLRVVSADELSPRLEMAPADLAQEKLSPQQAGVINNTDPHIELDCNWLVNNRLVLTVPILGDGAVSSFEYEPNLYFMVARPPLVGQTYNLQDFANMTRYPLPTTDTEVYISVTSGDEGRWNFTFSERV